MRIAILGTRGVPANYGGFETFAEELGKRLVQRGHQVTSTAASGPSLPARDRILAYGSSGSQRRQPNTSRR